MHSRKSILLLPFDHWQGNHNDSVSTAEELAENLHTNPFFTAEIRRVKVSDKGIEEQIEKIKNEYQNTKPYDLILGIGMLEYPHARVKFIRSGVTSFHGSKLTEVSWVNTPLEQVVENWETQCTPYQDEWVIGMMTGLLSKELHGFMVTVGNFRGRINDLGRTEQVRRLTGFITQVTTHPVLSQPMPLQQMGHPGFPQMTGPVLHHQTSGAPNNNQEHEDLTTKAGSFNPYSS